MAIDKVIHALSFKDVAPAPPNEVQKINPSNANDPSIFISLQMIDAINYRIVMEEHSSRIYLAMHLWLEDQGFFNAAKLWKKFSSEENNHADWCRDHLLSLNILPQTREIPVVPNEFLSIADVVYKTLEHEITVTQQCKDLAKLAMQEGDTLAYTLAHKMVAEQVEELKKSFDLVNLAKRYDLDSGIKLNEALFDHELEKFV